LLLAILITIASKLLFWIKILQHKMKFQAFANKHPTDLGVLGLEATKAATEKLFGPSSTDGHLVPDDFSSLPLETRIKVSREGRAIASNKFAAVKDTLLIWGKAYLLGRLLRRFLQNFASKFVAKSCAWFVVLSVLYRRWGAKERFSKGEYLGPTLWPFFGGFLNMAAHRDILHDHLLNSIRNAGFKTIEIPVPMTCFVILMDVRDREYVLKTNPWNFLKNRKDDVMSFDFVFSELLGRGIFATEKSEWFDSRKIASHMFSGHALRSQMEHVFNSPADRTVRLLEKAAGNNTVVDFQEIFQCAVFDAFCEIAFGVFPNATESAIEGVKPAFLVSFDYCQNVASERVARSPLDWQIARLIGSVTGTGKEGRFIKHMKVIDDYVYKIINERLYEKDISSRTDLLSLYIQHSRNQGEQFTLTDFRDIIVNFMIAGRDTTSCTLTYAMKFLGENPQCVARLREEGLCELGKTDPSSNISWEASKSIPYTDAVVNEVLRMAPPVGDDFRICVSDDVLPSGLRIRDGTRVALCNVAIGRDPFLWSNPETFDPERWMKYDEEGTALPVRRVDELVHPIFFAGRRLCLGKDMARFEAIVFMSKILSRFDISVIPNQDTTMVMGPVIFMRNGLRCRLDLVKA